MKETLVFNELVLLLLILLQDKQKSKIALKQKNVFQPSNIRFTLFPLIMPPNTRVAHYAIIGKQHLNDGGTYLICTVNQYINHVMF